VHCTWAQPVAWHFFTIKDDRRTMADEILRSRLNLQAITEADLPFLYTVYASTRQEELAHVPWTEAQKEEFLRFQFSAQHQHYQQHYTGASFDLILLDGQPAGRLYVARWQTEIRIVDIALLPEYRNLGIGTLLLNELIAEAQTSGLALSIHVEQNNPALRLYQRLGFQVDSEYGVYYLMRKD
jgi:ribosomal protein S18 acetylase RimI-like enzyme